MNNEQRIAFLKNPHLPPETKSIKSQEQAADNIKKNLLKLALRNVKSELELGHLKEAKKFLAEINELNLAIDQDGKGWIKYFLGNIHEIESNTEAAIKAYKESLSCSKNSWSAYKLGGFHETTNPLLAFQYYSDALANKQELSAEAAAHAELWQSSFFNKDVYKRFNLDLNKANINLLDHYLKHVYTEKRIGGILSIKRSLKEFESILPKGFNWKNYLEVNSDLEAKLNTKACTLLEAEYILTRHFIDFGRSENRPWAQTIHKDIDKIPEQPYNEQKEFISRTLSRSLKKFLKGGDKIFIGTTKESAACITIIVVLFNKAEFTFNALKSIAKSSFKDISLIIVDNNSTDKTKELLDRLEGSVRLISNKENLHFLKSVNLALSHVKGKYIALLNNDAVLHEDTLEESLAALRKQNDTAIIGGKILHFDGYIQDAGSIVFSDGSCRGIGRRCEPGHHLFNFERKVDYISGVFMLTTSSILKKLGGLDEQYSPAYYEETDLCFRARAQNIPVIYDPNIMVNHVEFGSSMNTNQAKQLMEINQKKFREAHQAVLQKHLSPAAYNEYDINCLLHGHLAEGPKVLIIEDRIPDPVLGSGFCRSHDILSEVKKYASHTTLFATDFNRSKQTTAELPNRVECIEKEYEYLKELLIERSNFYDLIIVTREHNQNLFDQALTHLDKRQICLRATIVYDAESLFSIREYTRKHLLQTGEHIGTLKTIDIDSVVSKEFSRFEKADIITTVSNFEKGLITKAIRSKNVYVLGHPFSIESNVRNETLNRSEVAFIGAIHQEDSPNHDSIAWLDQEILPALSEAEIPNLSVKIGGTIKCDESRKLLSKIKHKYDFVEVEEDIQDLQNFFSDTLLFIAPTRYAAGIPHKIHMASHHGIPTITTTFVAEQMGWKKNHEILTADTPLEFATLIKRAYTDHEFLTNVQTCMGEAFKRDCNKDMFDKTIQLILANRN
jgi:GT2 family glycosyltransferase